VTFKLPEGSPLDENNLPTPIFGRAVALSLGQCEGVGSLFRQPEVEAVRPSNIQKLPEAAKKAPDPLALWQLAGDRPFSGLHVWHRDAAEPGERDYEPGIVPEDAAIAKAIRQARPDKPLQTWVAPGSLVLDCVVVEPDQWWLGLHRAEGPASCWPGGFCGTKLPPHAVSRAYLKMDEALRWSQLPLQAGQHVAELGCSPGGSAQALLDRGLIVTGIDPAEMHPLVLDHANFTHVRKRGHEVRRREFRKTRWLTADMNVAPHYTLDTVEAIVTYPETRIRGLLLTLKLLEWELAESIPEYLFRIRSWGYQHVHARQLQHNRQEICVAALR
jgi:23S rRNA (cytidine2498-2'-O)-methyltransferase